jgi:hypothetical protein
MLVRSMYAMNVAAVQSSTTVYHAGHPEVVALAPASVSLTAR